MLLSLSSLQRWGKWGFQYSTEVIVLPQLVSGVAKGWTVDTLAIVRMYLHAVFYWSSWNLLEVSKVDIVIPILQMGKLRLGGLPWLRASSWQVMDLVPKASAFKSRFFLLDCTTLQWFKLKAPGSILRSGSISEKHGALTYFFYLGGGILNICSV